MAIDFTPQIDFEPEDSNSKSDTLHDTTLAGRDARIGAVNDFIGKVGGAAIQAALPSPEAFNPIQPTSDNPVIGGAQAALQTLRDPTRISPTVSEPGQALGNKVTEKTGSKIAGFVTSVLADPQTYLGLGTGEIPKGITKQLSNVGEVLSGVDSENFTKLIKSPADVLKAKPSAETGALFQKAKELAGVTDTEERQLATKAEFRAKIYNKVMDKIDNDETPSISELLRAKRAAQLMADSNDPGAGFIRKEVSTKINPILKEESKKAWEALPEDKKALAPDVYTAQQMNHMSKVKESFMQLFPQGKGMYKYFRTVGMLAGGMFHGIGALESPAVAGTLALGGSLASKMALTPGGASLLARGLNTLQDNPQLQSIRDRMYNNQEDNSDAEK